MKKKLFKQISSMILVLSLIITCGAFNVSFSKNVSFAKGIQSAKVAPKVNSKMPLKYTKGFSVTYLKDGIKKVVDGDKRTLILVPNGKAVPAQYKKNIIIRTPINNVLVGSTTQGCLLRALNVTSSVKAVTTQKAQWRIKEIAQPMNTGKIKYVGENTAPDYEAIRAVKPSLAFTYSGPYGLQSMMQKFNELKINYAVDNSYLEENPLGRLEWIKFVAAFYNKEAEAEKYFNSVVSKVNATTKKVTKAKKPKVSWGMVYKGQVYIAKPGSYVTKMIEMAGGDYVFKNLNVPSGKISLEEFYAKSKDADVLMYSSMKQYSPTLQGIVESAPTLANLKAVKNKKVWCFNPDYYQSLDKTNELVEDLAAIFHPTMYSKYKVKHYDRYTK